MSASVERVRTNLAGIDRRITAACVRAGRSTPPRLLMASKYLDVDEMGILGQAGIGLVGENRAEGLEAKWSRWRDTFEFHFIGHLQSRKVRLVLPVVTLIHSVGSMSVVQEIEARAADPVHTSATSRPVRSARWRPIARISLLRHGYSAACATGSSHGVSRPLPAGSQQWALSGLRCIASWSAR